MTLSNIRDKVKRRVDDSDIDTSFLNDVINEVYYEILNDSRTFWKFMEGTTTFSTVAGTSDYVKATIGSDIDEIYDIFTDQGQLKSMNKREFDQFNYQNNVSGIPTRYIEWNGNITLYPTPSDVRQVTVRYYKDAVELTTDAQEPLIPRKFQDILVIGAALAFYEMDEDTARYDRAVPKYMKKLNDMMEKNETASDKTYAVKLSKGNAIFPDWDYR
jgi:hypothetical protein